MKDNNDNISTIKQKHLFFVFCLAQRDISMVIELLDLLTKKKAHSRDANIIALYIIYARIFGNNYGLPRLTPKKIGCSLTKKEINYHNGLLKQRNKFFAHYDSLGSEVNVQLDKYNKLLAFATVYTSDIDINSAIAKNLFYKIKKALNKKVKCYLQKLYKNKISSKQYIIVKHHTKIVEFIFEY